MISFTALSFTGCADQFFLGIAQHEDNFVSETYHHFEGGVLFTDEEYGLEILWKASFKDGSPYKENLGFFIEDGLLIIPNQENTLHSARLTFFRTRVVDGKLYIEYNGQQRAVSAIIHTHPEGLPEPTPQRDFQYCYLGIHQYVMSHCNLFDAYRDKYGNEVTKRIGSRNAYANLPVKKNRLMETALSRMDQVE